MLPQMGPGISQYIDQLNAARQAAGKPPIQMANPMLASGAGYLGQNVGAPPPPNAVAGGVPYQKPVNYDPRNPGGSFGAPGLPSPTGYGVSGTPSAGPMGDVGGGIVPSLNLGPPQQQQNTAGYRPLPTIPPYAQGLVNMQQMGRAPASQYAGIRVNAPTPAARPALPPQASPVAQQRVPKPSAPPRLGVTTHSPYAGTGGPLSKPPVQPAQPAQPPASIRDVQNLRNQFGNGGIPSVSQYMGNRTGSMVGAGAPRGLAALIGSRPMPSLPPQLIAELRTLKSSKRS